MTKQSRPRSHSHNPRRWPIRFDARRERESDYFVCSRNRRQLVPIFIPDQYVLSVTRVLIEILWSRIIARFQRLALHRHLVVIARRTSSVSVASYRFEFNYRSRYWAVTSHNTPSLKLFATKFAPSSSALVLRESKSVSSQPELSLSSSVIRDDLFRFNLSEYP